MRRLLYAVLGPLAAFTTLWYFGVPAGFAQTAPAPSAAPGQEAFRSVTDPNGQYTIEVPDRWLITSSDSNLTGTTTLPGGIRMAGIARWSMVAAAAPEPAGAVPINVVVLTVILQSGASPSAIVQHLLDSTFVPGESAVPGIKLLKAGPLTVAGRDAFYMYQTITAGQFATPPGIYQILVFVPGDEALFVIGGQAANSPDRIMEATPLLLNIINTFHFKK